MVLLWIGFGIVIVIMILLIVKAKNTSKMDYVRIDVFCKNCGCQTNGLKCPKCEKQKLISYVWFPIHLT